LQWLKSFKTLRGRLARWLEQLASYQFTVEHIPGKEIPHVDFLSRHPNRPCKPDCQHCLKIELREQGNIEQEVKVSWTGVVPEGGIPPSEMIKDQRLDEALMPIITALLLDGQRPPFQDIVGND